MQQKELALARGERDRQSRLIDAVATLPALFVVFSARVLWPAVAAAFLLGVAVIDPQNAPHLLVDFVGIGLSTWVGAYVAFDLQRKREEKQLRTHQAASLRVAQFALVGHVGALLPIREYLEPFRSDKDRDIKLQPAVASFQGIPEIDLESLGFLLESHDPDLLNVLLDCQEKWNNVRALIELRFAEHRRFAVKLEAIRSSAGLGQLVTGDQVRSAVGPEISNALRTVTDSLFEIVGAAMPANEAAFNRLAAHIAEQFPGERALKRSLDAGAPPPTPGPVADIPRNGVTG